MSGEVMEMKKIHSKVIDYLVNERTNDKIWVYVPAIPFMVNQDTLNEMRDIGLIEFHPKEYAIRLPHHEGTLDTAPDSKDFNSIAPSYFVELTIRAADNGLIVNNHEMQKMYVFNDYDSAFDHIKSVFEGKS